MAKSVNTLANEKYRNKIVDDFVTFLQERGEDVQRTASNEICYPFVNELSNDEWLRITVAVPVGSRKDGEPFDGYEKAEDYARKEIERKKREAKQQADKEKKQEFDKKKREIAKKKATEE